MRITGGIWRSRILKVPRAGLRPSQDRLRQGLFSSLGAWIEGRRVLDLFAGTGALGLEALSRGAASACWVESDSRVLEVLRSNVEALAGRGPHLRIVAGDARDWARLAQRAPGPYDLVLADPPYEEALVGGYLEKTLRGLRAHSIVGPRGVLAYEAAASETAPDVEGWTPVRRRAVGDSQWMLYQCAAESLSAAVNREA